MADDFNKGKSVQAPDMADLLEYFEARSRALDDEGQPVLDASTLQFMSLIKFNGISILPPVLTPGRREEMVSYKHEAIRREKCTRAKKKDELHAKVQSIVAGVEERRAAKQASKSLKSYKSPSPGSKRTSDRHSSEVISKVTSKVTSPAVKVPSEIVVNITGKDINSTHAKPSSKSSTSKHQMSPSRSAVQGHGDAKKKEPTNYKSLGKVGSLSKQKSFSSQHLDRSGIQGDKMDSDVSTHSSKDLSLSPNSRALLPHPPVGRPPSRGSSMRQSSSTPDLRNIDAGIKTEDLRKPIKSGRSLSPKGGRPQASEHDKKFCFQDSQQDNKSTKLKDNHENMKKMKSEVSKVKSESTNKQKEISSDSKTKKNETELKKMSVDPKEKDRKRKTGSKSQPDTSSQLQNPLEILEQELSKEQENEVNRRFANVQGAGKEVRQELDPIQTATAELFPFPISEEQALATLDSLQSDFASLEQFDSLPSDYNGIPLTSLKQQQIIHMLTKLSKALNMEDTLTSTTTSNIAGESAAHSVRSGNNCDNRSVPNGAKGENYEYSGQSDLSMVVNDSSVSVTNESNTTNSSLQNSSAHSRARMSPTGSSILSSASSVSASRSRMSPKSLKNTVHFSTLVTEISTSASQSYEDKISYRKLDITPKSSQNFEDFTDGNTESRNRTDGQEARSDASLQVPSSDGSNMLSKVALSPSVDSSSGSPGEFQNQHPFENRSPDSDLNTSDKENEFVPADPESSDDNYPSGTNVRSGRNQPVLNVFTVSMPAGPIGENHPAVVHVKSSGKSDLSFGNYMKDGQEKVLQENFSKANMNLDSQFHYVTSTADLDRYIQGKRTHDDSISSMQEEITRSYLLSRNKLEQENYVEENFDFKKPKKVNNELLELDDSSVFLKPVIFSNPGNSLKENRSMLDEEDMIRSNLQKVQLEDTDSEEEYVRINSETELEKEEYKTEETELIKIIPSFIENEFINAPLGKEETGHDLEEVDRHVESDEGSDKDSHKCSDSEKEDGKDLDIVHNDGKETDDDDDNEEEQDNEDDENDNNDDNNSEIEIKECKDLNIIKNDNEGFVENQVYFEQPKENVENIKQPILIKEDINPSSKIQENFEQTFRKQEDHVYSNKIQENSEKVTREQKNSEKQIRACENTEHPIGIQINNEQPIRVREDDDCAIRDQEIEREEEAKAEHIQKYLNQVHEHSLHHEEEDDDEGSMVRQSTQNYPNVIEDIGALIQTYTSSIQSMNHLSQEELFKMQSDQFELIQQKLIEHQRAQLEELFVAQRKEQMSLQQEIEAYQQKINSLDTFSDVSIPVDPLKPQISRSMPQVTQAWQLHQQLPVHSSAKSPPFHVQPVAYNGVYQNPEMSFNTSYSTIAPYPEPQPVRAAPGPCHDPRMASTIDPRAGVAMNIPIGYIPDPNMSSISHNTSYSTIPYRDPGMLRGNQALQQQLGVIQSQDPSSSHSSNPFIYPSSPSLYINPKDRDNVSEVSGFAKATPKQLVFSNQSTPVPVTKTYKPIQHSPLKQMSVRHQPPSRYTIPDKVFDPAMQPKFARVSAAVKGYLTRRLLKTPKVQEIIQKLSDTRNFAFSFQAETPIKKGTFSREDRTLLERIVNQLQASLIDIHEIFFVIPVSERMAIISAARQLEEERRMRESQRHSMESVSKSQPKLSKATLKALERKKKAQLAEESVFGSAEFRPKSAPPSTSSPHLSTDVRALRPLQGQISPITGDHQVTVREMKERPRSAVEKKKSAETGNKAKKSGNKKTASNGGTSKQKSVPANTAKTKKLEKAWR